MAQKQITTGTTKKFLQDINDNFNELYGFYDMRQKIIYGIDAPSNTIGNNGDVYIQYED